MINKLSMYLKKYFGKSFLLQPLATNPHLPYKSIRPKAYVRYFDYF